MSTHTQSGRTYTQKEAEATLPYVSRLAQDIKEHYASKVMMDNLAEETSEGSGEREQFLKAAALHEAAVERAEEDLDALNLYVTDRAIGQVCFPSTRPDSVWTWRPGQSRNVFLITSHITNPDIDAGGEKG